MLTRPAKLISLCRFFEAGFIAKAPCVVLTRPMGPIVLGLDLSVGSIHSKSGVLGLDLALSVRSILGALGL